MDTLDRILDQLPPDPHIVVLTGAGISAESGVPTFRGAGGLWRNHRAEELATAEAFRRDPELVWQWYEWRRGLIAPLMPNPAHHALMRLEQHWDRFLLVTQNVDGLHGRAGSQKMVEVHGNLWRARCWEEDEVRIQLPETPLPELPPRHDCGALLRPDVVWFGEALDPDVLQQTFDFAEKADLCLVVGTSSIVYPAAALPQQVLMRGQPVIEVNLDPTPLTPHCTLALQGAAGEQLPVLVDRLLEHLGATS